MKFLLIINTALLGGILICGILIASRPCPTMTAGDYMALDKKKRDLLIPVVAVKGRVGVSGEVSINGPVEIDTSSAFPLSVIIENDELTVAPSAYSHPFPVKIDEK